MDQVWNTLCPPAQIYPIFMSSLVLFNLYRGTYKHAISNIVGLLIGTFFLWILCAAKLEFVAYALLTLPVIFFVFLLAILFYDQSLLDIRRKYGDAQRWGPPHADIECKCCELPTPEPEPEPEC